MKVGFFYDYRISKGKDGDFYAKGLSYEIWERYLNIFSEIIVCTRQEEKIIENYKEFKKSSGENVKFKLNSRYKTPIDFFLKRKYINEPISNVIEEVDCCIVRLPSVIGILAIKECIKQGKPWVVEVVGCAWESLWHYGNIKGKLFAPIMYLYNKYYISKSKYALYVSREFLQNRYPSEGITTNISDVNLEDFNESILEKRIKKINKKLDKDRIEIGLVGSLDVDYKGHETAIKAIKLLENEGYNVVLKCLGGGNANRWKKLSKDLNIEERVIFCGTLASGKPVLKWLDEIDVFIMPSITEGLPRTMVEAMSRGCNILGSNIGGIPELIEEDFLFSPKDYKSLSSLIKNLINNKDIAIRQSNQNFEGSKQYLKEKLDNRRNDFFNKVKNDINNQYEIKYKKVKY